MRLALVDTLMCPRCSAFPLDTRIEAEVIDPTLSLAGYRCGAFCGDRKAAVPAGESCDQCLRRNIITGALICPTCQSTYPITDGIANFLLEEHLDSWVTDEHRWWDNYYQRLRDTTDITQRRKETDPAAVPGIRFYERWRWLFTHFHRERGDTRGRPLVVLEIGAGMAETVANLYPPSKHNYLYIGTDVSKPALQIAARLVPGGEFIQCTVDHLPFRPQAFQAVFCFGVLHHIPRWQTGLERMAKLLESGGQILFEETIEKPRVLGFWRKESFTAAQDSPHEGELALGDFERVARQLGTLSIRRLKSTPVRFGLTMLAGKIIHHSLWATKLAVQLDYAAYRIFRRVFKSFGPGEMIGTLKVP